MGLKEKFPKVLNDLLVEKSFTVDELSRRSGITVRQIYFLKKGKYTPKLETLNSIASSFNLELDELLRLLADSSNDDSPSRGAIN